jgi:dihydrofolate reductase
LAGHFFETQLASRVVPTNPQSAIRNPQSIRAIAAMSLNRVIGAGGKIPWHIADDFRFFKATTMGHTLLMGHKTFESIGRPLPGRATLVVSRAGFAAPGITVIRDLAEARPLTETGVLFICGGAEIYAQTLPLCSELFLSVVKRDVEGDAIFPPFDHLFTLREVVLENPEFEVRHYVRKLHTP